MTTADKIREFGKTGKVDGDAYAVRVLRRYCTIGINVADTQAIFHALADLPDEAWGSKAAVEAWQEKFEPASGTFPTGVAQDPFDFPDAKGTVEWKWTPKKPESS